MAEILTQRALLLAEIEATLGVDPVPSPTTAAYQVAEPDFSADITVIERNFARQSLSPLPVATGRKLASITFQHEVRSNGSFDGSTAPRLGKLLRACGMAESAVTANGTTNGRTTAAADSGNGGPTTTWAFGGANAILRPVTYRARVVVAGVSGVAAVRVTGGANDEDVYSHSSQEADAILTETFCVETVLEQGTHAGAPTVDDSTDPTSIDYDFSGLTGLTTGDQFRVTVLGIPFLVTLAGAATASQLGTEVAAAIDAHPLFAAASVSGDVTVTFETSPASEVTPTVVTSGVTAVALGASGHTAVPTWTGSLVLNDAFTFVTKPTGFEYRPVSTGFESITLYLYYDGVLHRLTAARGTFTVEAPGGNLANFTFTFTGNYEAVTDAAIPSATFETTIPGQVELAEVQVNPRIDQSAAAEGAVCDTWEDQVNGIFANLCAGSFNIDLANNIVPRQCINEADSYQGSIITGRAPSGSFDPELELVADHDFWNLLATADVLSWEARVGTVRGNVVRFEAPGAQYSGLSYSDRDGLRVLNVDLRFSASAPTYADDELTVRFL